MTSVFMTEVLDEVLKSVKFYSFTRSSRKMASISSSIFLMFFIITFSIELLSIPKMNV